MKKRDKDMEKEKKRKDRDIRKTNEGKTEIKERDDEKLEKKG